MLKKKYPDFDSFDDNDRKGVFQEAGRLRSLDPYNVEKDYWVCRVLGPVMKSNRDEPRRVFKGGTSLSKGFGLIERFSEDIDIVLARDDLIVGSGNEAVDAGLSERQRRTRFSKLRKAARNFLHGPFIDTLRSELPSCDIEVGPDRYGMTILVSYPTLFPIAVGGERYNQPTVKIEANIKAADFPVLRKHINPYVSEVLPADDWSLTLRSVTVLSPERTFWEKVMAIHARHCQHRDSGKIDFDAKKVSRHYYDLAMLLQTAYGRRALKDLQLMADTREHDKIVYFEEKWRCSDEAKPGTLFVLPPDDVRKQLEEDFQAMQGMVYGAEIPSFEWVIDQLRKIDQAVNGDLFPPKLPKGKTAKRRTNV
jgi:Nucleotidyl transferase AbiEii toxin, Type IV TA system